MADVSLQMTYLSLELLFFLNYFFLNYFQSELPPVDSGILVLQINRFQRMNTIHSTST